MSSSSDQARALLIGDSPLKLEYFAIEGVVEQVRIALSVAGVPFDDAHVNFSEWGTKKATTKYGQLPEMTLPDGTLITESMAMLRLAGEADPEGKLYPADIASRLRVEQALGLVGDLGRAWRAPLYIGMRPQVFGYPPKDEWEGADAMCEKLRSGFLADDLPKYMGYITDMIEEAGGNFLTGDDLTIADIAAYMQIKYFTKGFADHVPKDCIEPYTEVLAYMGRVEADPRVSAYQSSKAK